jgi:hypothetical protein
MGIYGQFINDHAPNFSETKKPPPEGRFKLDREEV